MRPYVYWLGIALAGAAAGDARADDDAAAPPAPVTASDAAAAPAPDGADTLTLPKGRVFLNVLLEMDLSSGAVFKPVSLAPDIWYGVSDRLTVGLVHSTLGETGFMGAVGDSLCLTGSSNGCGNVYSNVGLDARYGLKQGKISYAFDGGLDFRSIPSPFQLAIKLGVVGRWRSDKIAIEFEPELFFGLTNRDGTSETVGGITTNVGPVNHDELAVPITIFYDVAPKIALSAQTGLILPFEDTGDTYEIPLSVGVHYRVSVPASVQLAFSFPDLLGGVSSGDIRTLTLGGSYAF